MGKFLAVHTLSSPTTTEQAAPIAKAVKAGSSADAYWVGSWLQMNEQGKITKLFCEWNAKDGESIRRVLAKIPQLPTDGIYSMGKVDAEAYR
jgi:hypothetical protein